MESNEQKGMSEEIIAATRALYKNNTDKIRLRRIIGSKFITTDVGFSV